MIPSTLFVMAGVLLFPDMPAIILLISMAGVIFSACILYFFPDFFGLNTILEEKYATQIVRLKGIFKKKGASVFVLGWSFFPLVPTDLICYVVSLAKLSFKNMIVGVFVGEILLNAGYIYLGKSIFAALGL